MAGKMPTEIDSELLSSLISDYEVLGRHTVVMALRELQELRAANSDGGVEPDGAFERLVLEKMGAHLPEELRDRLTYAHGPYEITKVRNTVMTWVSAIVLAHPPAKALDRIAVTEELDATDFQTLVRLREDNVWNGSRSVLERPRTDPDTARAFALSERGLIALEQVALGVRLHITRKGVRALEAALAVR